MLSVTTAMLIIVLRWHLRNLVIRVVSNDSAKFVAEDLLLVRLLYCNQILVVRLSAVDHFNFDVFELG